MLATKLKNRQEVLAAVVAEDSGAIEHQHGDFAEVLSGILGYAIDIANLIGDSLGLDEVQEMEIGGKRMRTVLVPLTDGRLLGMVVDKKADIPELLRHLTNTVDDDEKNDPGKVLKYAG